MEKDTPTMQTKRTYRRREKTEEVAPEVPAAPKVQEKPQVETPAPLIDAAWKATVEEALNRLSIQSNGTVVFE